MENIEKNLDSIHQRIERAASEYGRDKESVCLLAVSKRKPESDIRLAWQAGQKAFGENYLQEALQKKQELSDLDIEWHFIGAIQSNKTRPIAEEFDWAHCIDRAKIARRLSEQRSTNKPPINICIQVNLDHEDSKAGIQLEDVYALAEQIADLTGVRLRGLMTIPAPRDNIDEQRAAFRRLKDTLTELNRRGFDCDTLSMGMTQDMEAAIAEGSTIVRIGTAIFGERE